MVDFAKLRLPFEIDKVNWRLGATNGNKTKGMALAYIDARDVMERLDQVCSPAGWQCRYSHAEGKTICEIGIKVGDEWVWKADGAGNTDTEAEKGALSDAFKRAAVRWGIGRYLYDISSPWVAIEQRGRSYVIKDGQEGTLRKCLAPVEPTRSQQLSQREVQQAAEDLDRQFADTVGPIDTQAPPFFVEPPASDASADDWTEWCVKVHQKIKVAGSSGELKAISQDNKTALERCPEAKRKMLATAKDARIEELKKMREAAAA